MQNSHFRAYSFSLSMF